MSKFNVKTNTNPRWFDSRIVYRLMLDLKLEREMLENEFILYNNSF